MCQTNNASIEDVRKAEVECLRKILAEKDKEIQRLQETLDAYDRQDYDRWIKETKARTGRTGRTIKWGCFEQITGEKL